MNLFLLHTGGTTGKKFSNGKKTELNLPCHVLVHCKPIVYYILISRNIKIDMVLVILFFIY